MFYSVIHRVSQPAKQPTNQATSQLVKSARIEILILYIAQNHIPLADGLV